MSTYYHAKYLAYDLTRTLPSNDIGKFTASLQDAQVDLNPHQIEAALFAFKSPLSQGAILADEVGLGKTIEAGIILSQQWAEQKRKLLIICPANLRKQWSQELQDKFFLSSLILENKSFNTETNKGNLNPFDQSDRIVICSFQFAKSKQAYLKKTPWSLVVIDEAHRLRNVYKSSNVIGQTIKNALQRVKKVLLTATPLQNSISELYGLISIIDDYTFGDIKSFNAQYGKLNDTTSLELRKRLEPICHRTLRRQVLEYIKYTNRTAILQEYYPSELEHELYEGVTNYLQRQELFGLPKSQRSLMTLILRKLLASSTFAIRNTFDNIILKLQKRLIADQLHEELPQELITDFELDNEVQDEWELEDEENENKTSVVAEAKPLTSGEIRLIDEEIAELQKFRELASQIDKNAKADQLFIALEKAFERLDVLGAPKKALIFTESRRTQDFLLSLFNESGYAGKIVLFNGSNSDEKSKQIYAEWLIKYRNTDRITGSATADKRAAIVEYFKEEAIILIATEAAAEGVNLQFCSLVVNYDMPWNPQRIEQRIGRCHRYGQKFDVVVVNFLNKRNAADVHIYKILEDKFHLFNGIFGASDEVLGAIGNGVDFEKRIAQIYQTCRSTLDIDAAFEKLQAELQPQITEKKEQTHDLLVKHFDEEVREKLRIDFDYTKKKLSVFEDKLWRLTRFALADFADFDEKERSFFFLNSPNYKGIHAGPYMMLIPKPGISKTDIAVPDDTNVYRIGHPLAQIILQESKLRDTPTALLAFDYSGSNTNVTFLDELDLREGWIQVQALNIAAFDSEDHLLIACFTERGDPIPFDIAKRFFSLEAKVIESLEIQKTVYDQAAKICLDQRTAILSANNDQNRKFFDVEMEKLELWSEDRKKSLEKHLKDLSEQIKLLKGEARKTDDLQTKIEKQRLIKDIERKLAEARQSLYQSQDDIEAQKDALLDQVEQRMKQVVTQEELFTIKWQLV